jgi:DNA-binding MurR/RpiR family transcriptional regulator
MNNKRVLTKQEAHRPSNEQIEQIEQTIEQTSEQTVEQIIEQTDEVILFVIFGLSSRAALDFTHVQQISLYIFQSILSVFIKKFSRFLIVVDILY